MKNPQPNRGERFFRLILQLYPIKFKQRYQDEMLQTFHDLQQDHKLSWSRFWIHLLTDYVVSLSREHIRNLTNPKIQFPIMNTPSSLKLFSAFIGLSLSVALVYIAFQPEQSSARTVIGVRALENSPDTALALTTALNTENLLEVTRHLNLQEHWATEKGAPPTPQEIVARLKETLSMQPISGTEMVSIQATGIDTGLAQDIINGLLKIVEEKNPEQKPHWSVIQSSAVGGIQGPNIVGILAMASVTGLMSGGLAVFLSNQYEIRISRRRRSLPA